MAKLFLQTKDIHMNLQQINLWKRNQHISLQRAFYTEGQEEGWDFYQSFTCLKNANIQDMPNPTEKPVYGSALLRKPTALNKNVNFYLYIYLFCNFSSCLLLYIR